MNLTKKLFYMPEAASEHAHRIDQMIDYVHWLMLLLFIGWGVFFVYTLVRFRRKANPTCKPVKLCSEFVRALSREGADGRLPRAALSGALGLVPHR